MLRLTGNIALKIVDSTEHVCDEHGHGCMLSQQQMCPVNVHYCETTCLTR